MYLRGNQGPQRGEPLGEQDRALGVDVVGGSRAARERDVADHERMLAQLSDQAIAGAGESTRILVQVVHRAI